MPASSNNLSRSSLLFWLPLTAALGIMLLGATFLISPQSAAERFGVPLESGNCVAFAYAKGIRDIFSGLVGLPFLFAGQRRAVAWMMLAATIIPIADGFIMMKFAGLRPAFLAIHWGAALYMVLMTVLLFRAGRLAPTQTS